MVVGAAAALLAVRSFPCEDMSRMCALATLAFGLTYAGASRFGCWWEDAALALKTQQREALRQAVAELLAHDAMNGSGGGRRLPPTALATALLVQQPSNWSHRGDKYGAQVATADGVLRYRDGYYLEVRRKSVHNCVSGRKNIRNGKCVGGFGRETDNNGFFHFVGGGSGIFLLVGTPVIDYTCPPWVVNATSDFHELHLLPTGRRYKRPQPNSSTVFDRPLAIKCVRGWCTPAACARAASGAFDPWQPGDRINEPAFWKSDPPVWEHHLRAYAFGTAIVLWAGHDVPMLQRCRRERSCERSLKVLVDLRRYGVTDESYQNGSHMIACPPGHHYHVVRNREMRPCACVEHKPRLNCAQLSELRRRAITGIGTGNVSKIRKTAQTTNFKRRSSSEP